MSKLPILHDGVVIFVLVLSLGENKNLDPGNLDPKNLDPINLIDPENRIVLVTNIHCTGGIHREIRTAFSIYSLSALVWDGRVCELSDDLS